MMSLYGYYGRNRMKKKNGYTTIELLIVLAIFTLGYAFFAIKASYAFNYDESESNYEYKIHLIQHQARLYAQDHTELFKDSDNIDIYTSDLIKNGYIIANENNDIVDPRDSSKTLDDYKVTINKNGDTYTITNN
jgi:type II secretory pathway pseudopilin PulG